MKLTHDRYHDLHSAFQDMVDFYGQSTWSHFLPELVLYYDPGYNCMGEFDDTTEEVSINVAKCYTMRQAIGTKIHKNQHYLQPRNGWYDRHYKNGHTYESHPYEVEANEVAARDWRRFMPDEYLVRFDEEKTVTILLQKSIDF